jgi:cyclopropane fatty-acyl-phospholipid synthase-like methyltransferase
MDINDQAEYITALIDLHYGLEHKGPGDRDFSLGIINALPPLPPKPQIADLGCGSGVSALLLAQHYHSNVMAVDSSSVFITELSQWVDQLDLQDLVTPICEDMSKLNWSPGSIDLLWSEGAAYNLGFEQALNIWRPLLSKDGVAVLSELSWFSGDVPKSALDYWQSAYPGIGSEQENIDRAERSGFQVISTQRLPSQIWWTNYYQPLSQRIKEVEMTPVMESVVAEIEEEMALFRQFSDFYGYSFYILRKT